MNLKPNQHKRISYNHDIIGVLRPPLKFSSPPKKKIIFCSVPPIILV